MKIRSRIERLKDELLPLPAGPAWRLHINAVDSEGKVVKTIVFEVPQQIAGGEGIAVWRQRGAGEPTKNAARWEPGGALWT